jgi:hypothetical protein
MSKMSDAIRAHVYTARGSPGGEGVEKFKWKNYSRERRQCQRITSRTIIPIVAAAGGGDDDDDDDDDD